MKLLKSVFIILAFVLLFSSCSKEPSEEIPMADFNGNPDEYVFMHESERDLKMEKIVIEAANTFLSKHPRISNTDTKITTDLLTEEHYFSTEFYDESLRLDFINQINLLIPKIPELRDEEVCFELQRAVATLKDGHSIIFMYNTGFYPIYLEAFYTENGAEFYAVSLPIEHEDAVYSKLISINSVPIEEIIEKGSPYISAENIYTVYSQLESELCSPLFLANIGVIGWEDTTADYTFVNEYGEEFILNLSSDNYSNTVWTETHTGYKNLLMYKYSFNFWYEFIDDETLYIKMNAFDSSDYSSLLKITTELEKAVTPESPINKTIIDFRNNPGGSKVHGYNEFIEMINGDEFGSLYAIINDNTFSMGVVMTSILKERIERINLVGTPAGEPPLVFGVVGNPCTFSYSDFYFQIGEYAITALPGYEYDALMPDIRVDWNIEDYKNGIDTVLEAVLALD